MKTDLEKLQTAVNFYHKGCTEDEIRKVIQLADGNVFREEINAVMLKLHSTSGTYNERVTARIYDAKKESPYLKGCEYVDYIEWNSGWSTADLAIKLHGKEAVSESL